MQLLGVHRRRRGGYSSRRTKRVSVISVAVRLPARYPAISYAHIHSVKYIPILWQSQRLLLVLHIFPPRSDLSQLVLQLLLLLLLLLLVPLLLLLLLLLRGQWTTREDEDEDEG